MRKRLAIAASILVTTLVVLLPLSTGMVAYAEEGSINIGGYVAAASSDEIYCCITYDANGGAGSCVGADVPSGESDTVLSAAEAGISRAGYSFTGWNTNADGSGIACVSGDSLVLNDNITLYAQWTVVATKEQTPEQRKAGQTSLGAVTTGDESSIIIWISVIFISLTLLIAVWIIHRKRKRA